VLTTHNGTNAAGRAALAAMTSEWNQLSQSLEKLLHDHLANPDLEL
jgi:hypothetical protein